MSYVSLLKNIPEFLSQPTGIAAIASLGIHSAIAFVLPMVPMDSKPKQEPSSKSSVGLVELSQAEKSRLPQPGAPQLSLQPLQPPTPVLPQVPPMNLANQSIPPLPPIPASPSSTDLILPPLPKTNNVAIASLPKSQSLPILSKRDLQPAPPLISTKVKPFTPYVEKVKLGEPKPLESSRIPYNVPPIQAANIPQEQELVNNYAPVSPEQMPVASSAEGVAQQTTEPAGVAQNQQLVTPVVQPPQVGDNSIALRGQNLPQLPQGSNFQAPKLPSLVPQSPSVTTEQLASKPKTFVERFTEAKNQYPNLESKQPVAAIVNPKTGQEGNVQGDLVVNGEGKVESINFENNSVPSELKTEVREYFREYFQNNPAQANGKHKFYPFNISFKPNSSNISKTPAPESTLSRVNQTQSITKPQQSLILRLRSGQGNSQASKEPQKVNLTQGLRPVEVNSQASKEPQKVNLSQGSRPVEVNSQASKEPQKVNLTRGLRPVEVNSLPSAQKVNLTQPSASSSVNQRLSQSNQTASAPQPDREQQTSRQQVVIRQTTSSSQSDKEQQTSRQQVVVRQSTSQSPTKEEQTSKAEVSSNQPSASIETSKKLLQQLRQIRDKRQGSNQEK
ncbi:hypothetical protein SAMD00079811_21480 [Scytonema sp. HK-05]|uniref:hypothetical protein n=1 Tax=Scytonema sp. HK-05 TaxID=1137095 RepID=UPI000936AC13|nr:hypothetical protein [Scytonema sp. HK-05]OKH57630.1 hypothetical protein NIES2130_18940 [Scytonema sp. HK-05]BAY44548.1 hypothetical protein SAMD00079811_21480 [Scytonema sp. HK-05]